MTGSFHVLVFVLSSLGPPTTDGEAAQRAVERAKVHVAAGEYDRASEALAEAHALDPDPAFLYARAQAERFGGDCATAVKLYRAFLAEDPPSEDRALAERYVGECERELQREAPEPAREPPPVVAPTASEPKRAEMDESALRGDDDPRPAARPWIADVAGGVLVGTGAVGLAVGLGFYGRSVSLDRSADRDARDQDEFVQRIERAVRFNRVGLATIGVGSALLAAGVIRYAVVGARSRRQRSHLGWLGLPRGGGVFLMHRF